MAQADGVVANGTGAAVRADLNNQLAAVFTNHSGSSEPATTYAYQFWADTSANVLKIRNSANNAWITLRELDGTMLLEDGSASTPGLAFADDVNTGIFSPAADSVAVSTGGTERVRITSTGAIAIEGASNYGTSGQVLTSNGNDAPTWQAASGGASDIDGLSDGVTYDSGLSLGLGTNALANDDGTDNNNTAVGYQALQATTSGSDNTALGSRAGNATNTGSNNVAVGSDALLNNTSASNNTACGADSLNSNSTGTQNTAFGKSALQNNTTANANTAVGYYALGTNDTGTQNVAVGGATADANTTGNYLTAVGYNALSSNTTGSNSVAIGRNALTSNTTANNNTAVGYQALFSNQTGTFCTAIGHEALYNNTNNNNTGIGYFAGRANTTGENNIYIGLFSGRGRTTGSKNVGIGNETFESSGTSQENVAVGHQALTNCSSGDNNVALGCFAGDTITVGYSNICIGKGADTNTAARFNSITIGTDIASVGTNFFTFGSSGNRVYNNFSSNASWSRSSDVRLKKDIQTNTDLGLGFINDLRTVTYKWKAPSELDSALPGYNADKAEAEYANKMYGFIAQEVKQALDDRNVTDFAGWTTDDEGIQGISYEMFVMPLVKAVQELSAENTALKARLDAAGI